MRGAIVLLAGLLSAGAGAVAPGCRGCASCHEDELEEEEERDRVRDHFWRFELVIEGQGAVVFPGLVDCARDPSGQRGACGPALSVFKELSPPLLDARPAPGWRFDHWRSLTRAPDGGQHGRAGPMPDNHYYINGFGYADTGELETVTAVFVPAPLEAGALPR